MPENVDLTISIVSYNTRDMLERCLNSVFELTKGISYEVIVVDNASPDRSAELVREKFPQVKLIANAENRYFARAHNQALKTARGRYCVILNPDLYFQDDVMAKLVRFLDAHPEAGAAGPRISNTDGTPQGSGDYLPGFLYGLFELLLIHTLWPSNPVRAKRTREGWPRDRTEAVEEIGGACLMVPRSIFDTVGMMDEGFLMYWEEIDWCNRILKSGKKIYFVSEAEVFHHGGGSINKMGRERKERIFYASMLYYYRKHFGWPAWLALKVILTLFTFPALKVARAVRSFL